MPLSTSSTCMGCLRRLALPFGTGSSAESTIGAMSTLRHQTRAKSTTRQAQDQGVVVRLLKDIPKFGRQEAIFRVERGRMRNKWYPTSQAEYMTTARFHELGLTRKDIGERDRGFIPLVELTLPEEPSPKPVAAIAKPVQADPQLVRELLATAIPDTLTFFRKPIPVPPPPPSAKISPLVAPSLSAPLSAAAPIGIFGSVSATDVVHHIKELLSAEPTLARFQLEPQHIRFVGVEEGSDRLKALGQWEVELSVNALLFGGNTTTDSLEPIRKMVEILPAA